jgi:hypothetical protein
LCADIPSLRQPTVHNVRILTLHNHLRVGAAQLQTVSRFDPLTVQAGDGTDGAENRLRIVCTPSLTSWVSVRAECAGRPAKGSLDKRSGELATMIEAAIPPASRAARSSPRRSTTTIRNPRAGCDGTIVSVMRENASAPRRGNCVVSLTAGSVRGGIRRILGVSWTPCPSTRIGGTRNRWRPADDRFARYEAVERQPKLRHECSPCETGGARHQNMRPRVLGR